MSKINYTVEISVKKNLTPSDFKESFELSEDEFFKFKAANRGSYGILPMAICVISLGTLKHLAVDLCCPTFFNCALKTSKVAGRVVFGIGFLFLDLITLPLRLVTLLPRLGVNIIQPKEKNSAYRFLEQNSINPNIYRNVDTVYCTVIKKEGEKIGTSTEIPFHFTPVPKPIEHDQFPLI